MAIGKCRCALAWQCHWCKNSLKRQINEENYFIMYWKRSFCHNKMKKLFIWNKSWERRETVPSWSEIFKKLSETCFQNENFSIYGWIDLCNELNQTAAIILCSGTSASEHNNRIMFINQRMAFHPIKMECGCFI